jgi:hypothetical protein
MNPKWDTHSFAKVLSMPKNHPMRGVGRYSSDEISARSGEPFIHVFLMSMPDNVFRSSTLDIVARCPSQSKAVVCGTRDLFFCSSWNTTVLYRVLPLNL